MYDPWELEHALYARFRTVLHTIAITGGSYSICDVMYKPKTASYRFIIYTNPVYIKKEGNEYIESPSYVSIVPKRLVDQAVYESGLEEFIRDIAEGIILVVESQ